MIDEEHRNQKTTGTTTILPYRPEVEALRGLACTLVFVFHFWCGEYGYEAKLSANIFDSLLSSANTGVTLFFVISGYLLSRPFIARRDIHVLTYAKSRMLRILPPYYASVLIAAILCNDWLSAAKSLFFYDIEINTLFPFGSVWWSLVTEVQFYIALPFIAFFLRPGKLHFFRVLIILSVLAFFYTEARKIDVSAYSFDLRDSFLARWPAFMMGAGVAWLKINKPRLQPSSLVSIFLIACSVAGLTVIAKLITHHYGFLAHAMWFDHYVIESLIWAIIMFSLFGKAYSIAPRLLTQGFEKLGTLSYSIYLTHLPVIFFVTTKFPSIIEPFKESKCLFFMAMILCYGLVVMTSMITYKIFEAPFLKTKKSN